MKTIIAKELSVNIEDAHVLLGSDHAIDNNNWDYPEGIKADFNIGFSADNIYLNFVVQEMNTKAVCVNFNEPVYEDSCVEFFISFDEVNYYNLEFNCIGNVLGGYGKGKTNREELSDSLLKQIKTKPSLGRNKIDIRDIKTEWTLSVVIPKSVFKYSDIDTLKAKVARCNFYKCGDKQAIPHYLSWSPIGAESPNFHLPEFFGKVIFK